MAVPGKPKSRIRASFSKLADRATKWTGTAFAFGLALAVIIVWAVTGPLFHFSDTWQLVINTGTTIVTFLMVFLIQHAQNKDTAALHLKLNELVAAVEGASNHLIDIEDMDEEELQRLHERYQKLAARVKEHRGADRAAVARLAEDLKRRPTESAMGKTRSTRG